MNSSELSQDKNINQVLQFVAFFYQCWRPPCHRHWKGHVLTHSPSPQKKGHELAELQFEPHFSLRVHPPMNRGFTASHDSGPIFDFRGLGSPGAHRGRKGIDSKNILVMGVPQTMRFFLGGGMHFLYPLNLVSWEVPNYCTFCELRVPYRNLGLIFVCDVFESQTSSHHLSAVFPTMLLVYRAQQGGGVLTLKSTTERLCPFVWKGWLNNVPLVHGQLVNPSNFNCKSREQLHATSIFNLPVHLKLVMHLAGLVFVFLSPMSSLWNWHDWHVCWISKVMMVEAFWWWRERYLWPRNFTRKSFLEKKGPQDSDLEDPSKKLHPRSLT